MLTVLVITEYNNKKLADINHIVIGSLAINLAPIISTNELKPNNPA